MRSLIFALLLFSTQARAVAPFTTALYFNAGCSPENSTADGSGNGYTLGTVGAPAFQTIHTEGAYSTGSFSDSTYYTFPAGVMTAFQGSNLYTIEFSYYMVSGAGVAFSFFDGSNSYIYLTVSDIQYSSNGAVSAFANTLDTGVWHNVAVTWDGTNRRMYLDNVLKNTAALNAKIGTTVVVMHIGNYVASNGFAINGYIDNFRLSVGVARTSFPTVDTVPTPTPGPNNNLSPYMFNGQRPFMWPKW